MTGVPIGAPVLFCAAKYFRYDVAMSTILMHAGRALTPTTEITDAGILIREDTIEAIGPRSGMTLPAGGLEIRATNMTAVPGFMDLHIHGAGGHDVMAGTGAALRAITRKVSEYGTTSIVATTLTASTDQTLRAVEGIARYIAQQKSWESISRGPLSAKSVAEFIHPNGFSCRRPRPSVASSRPPWGVPES